MIEAARIYATVGANTAALRSGLASADSAVLGFARRNSSRLKTWTSGATKSFKVFGAITAAAMVYAGGQFANFETALNTFQAVSHATNAQMQTVSRTAKKLGADVHIPTASAGDAADAMTELAKGGLSVKESMDAARGTLMLAAAAGVQNAQAATIQARALNMFNLSGKQAGRVADVLANAANKSTGEITDFALGLQQSGAVAKQTGLNLNETTAALMELSDAGIVGSDAGTSLKTMLMRLSPTTAKQAKEMKKLGIDVWDAKGRFIGIQGAIRQYRKGLANLTPEEKKHALQVMFGSDAIRAANVIMGGGVKKYNEYLAATKKSGTAQKVAEAKTKGLRGAMLAVQNTAETAAISFGQAMAPGIEKAAGMVTNLIGAFDKLSGPAKTAVGYTLLGTTAALGMAAGLGKLVMYAQKTAAAETALGVGLKGTGKALKTVARVTRLAAVAQWAMNTAVMGFPLVWVVAAVVAVGVALVVLWKKSKTFRRIVTGAWHAIRSVTVAVFGAVKSFVTDAFHAIKSAFLRYTPQGIIISHWRTIRDVTVGTWNAVKGAVKAGVVGAYNWVRDKIGAVRGFLQDVKGGISRAAHAIGSVISSGVRGALSGIEAVIGKIKSLIGWIERIAGKVFHFSVTASLPHLPGGGGLLSHLPGFAAGGAVRAHRPVIVGERGPELFVPKQPGRIVPNDQLGATGGGATVTITGNTFVVRDEPDIRRIGSELGRKLAVA